MSKDGKKLPTITFLKTMERNEMEMEKKVIEVIEELKKEISKMTMEIDVLNKEDGFGNVEHAKIYIGIMLNTLLNLSEDYSKGLVTADTMIKLDSIGKTYEIVRGTEQ